MTPDTRRNQASCEQLEAAGGVKMNHSDTNVEFRDFLQLTNVSCQTKNASFKGKVLLVGNHLERFTGTLKTNHCVFLEEDYFKCKIFFHFKRKEQNRLNYS